MEETVRILKLNAKFEDAISVDYTMYDNIPRLEPHLPWDIRCLTAKFSRFFLLNSIFDPSEVQTHKPVRMWIVRLTRQEPFRLHQYRETLIQDQNGVAIGYIDFPGKVTERGLSAR